MSILPTTSRNSFPREAKPRDVVLGGLSVAASILAALFLTGSLTAAAGSVSTALMRVGQFLGAPPADTHVYWYMSRSAGVVAYLLLWGSVVWGLMVTNKVLDGAVKPLITFELHQFLSIAALVFGGFHAFILLGDKYIKFGIADLLVPFKSPYEPVWVGLGVLAMYLTTALVFSFYVKKRIGHKVWRVLHYSSFLGWVMVTFHGLMAGTDSGTRLMQVVYATTTLAAGFLIVYRILVAKTKKTRAVA